MIDDHIIMAYSGLNADGRILANKARIECQSYRLNYDDAPSVEYVAKHVAETKQKYTQKGGVRPFGLATLIGGFDIHGLPHLYTTDPSGSVSEWKANSIGKSSKQVSEYLEKHFKEDLGTVEATKLAVKSLLDVVESGNKNIELVIMTVDKVRHLTDAEIEEIVNSIKEE